MSRRFIGLVAFLGLALGFAVTPDLGAAQDGVDLRIVITRDANLYAEPRTDAEVLTVIPEGTILYYHHNVSNGFMFQTYDNQDGWMPLDAFVAYADYNGGSDDAQQGTGDVSGLPNTGVRAPVDPSFSLPLLGLAALGLGVVAVTIRRSAVR